MFTAPIKTQLNQVKRMVPLSSLNVMKTESVHYTKNYECFPLEDTLSTTDLSTPEELMMLWEELERYRSLQRD